MNWNYLIAFIVILFVLIAICALSSKEGMTTSSDDNTSSSDDSTYNTMMDALNNYFGGSSQSYTGPQGGQVNTYSGNNGQKATTYTSPSGNNYVNTSLSNNYDNYSHYNGTAYPLIYYGPNGGTARVIKTNNEDTIVVTSNDGHTDIYYIDNPNNNDSDSDNDDDDDNNNNIETKKYYGPNGGSAKMIRTDDGEMAVQIIGPDGNKVVYTQSSQDQPNDEFDNVDVNTYDGPAGGQYTTATGPDGGQAAYAQGPAGGQAAAVTGPDGNSAYAAKGPNDNAITGNTYDSNAYVNSLPSGIRRSQIPDGDEDLYILKSEVVPPVCPKCPDPILKCPGGKDLDDIPPCPPCARCPEPAFDCKKVPNFNSGSAPYLPQPVLSDFSTFGM